MGKLKPKDFRQLAQNYAIPGWEFGHQGTGAKLVQILHWTMGFLREQNEYSPGAC
jgi:hypothetical protein